MIIFLCIAGLYALLDRSPMLAGFLFFMAVVLHLGVKP